VSHNNVYFVEMEAMGANFPDALALFADVLLRPAISEEWVARVQAILLRQVLPNVSADGEEIAMKALREALYARHPYQRQRYGEPATVAAFGIEDVRRCYRASAVPGNCVLAIYGDIDPEQTEALVTRLFGGWEAKEKPASLVVADPGPAAARVIEVTNEQVRTNCVMGWRAPARQEDEKAWALSVLNDIIGSGGWLHARLREGDAHYVYAVHGVPYTGDGAGHYWIQTDFRPEDEAEVLEVIRGVVADAIAGAFSDEELANAKRALLCQAALGKRENAQVCQGEALCELYGQGWDYDERRFAGIAAVTRADVVAIAKEVFGRPAVTVLVRPAPEEKEGD
jgi:zinc protease